jgi:hypothetical protein
VIKSSLSTASIDKVVPADTESSNDSFIEIPRQKTALARLLISAAIVVVVVALAVLAIMYFRSPSTSRINSVAVLRTQEILAYTVGFF